MEITLRAKIEVEVWQTVEVDSIDAVRNAAEFFANHLYMAGSREVGDSFIEYEQTDVIDDVVVDDGEDFCDVDSFISFVNDEPDHPLHGSDDDCKHADFDELNDDHCAEADRADGVVDAVNTTPVPSNIIHIPQPPKCNRRAGFDAFKHAFKKLARRF